MLARLGTDLIELRISRDPAETETDINGWAFRGEDGALQVLLYCHHDDWDREGTSHIALTLENLPREGSAVITHYRIDREHSNACAEWERRGKPDWPDEEQRAAILARSGLEFLRAPETCEIRAGRLVISFPLPVHGISLLEIRQ